MVVGDVGEVMRCDGSCGGEKTEKNFQIRSDQLRSEWQNGLAVSVFELLGQTFTQEKTIFALEFWGICWGMKR